MYPGITKLPPIDTVLVDSYGAHTYLRTRSEFEIIDAMKELFKIRITSLKIEVSPGKVGVEVFHHDSGYKIEYVSRGRNVSIVPELASEEQWFSIPKEYVTQRYIPAALDFLKALFDDLEADTEIDQFEVIVANDKKPHFQVDKHLFFTTLQYHFHYMEDKMLNVGLFNMKYSGDEEDEEEVLTFLRKMNLVGEKTLKFELSCSESSELCLNKVFELNQWNKAEKFVMDPLFYLEAPMDKWMDFPRSTIVVKSISRSDVEQLLQHFDKSDTFISCEITTIEPNQCPEVFLLRGFQYKNDAEFRNSDGFEVQIDGNKYIFKAPRDESG